MKQRTLPLLGGFALVSALILTNCSSDPEPAKEGAYNNQAAASPDSLCLVNPSWFPHSQTPSPAEGKGSPFDVSSTTNQIFHQWSWNKFLWLTKPDNGGNPLFLNQTKVKQVTSHMQPVSIPAGTTVVLQDSAQAGSGAILQTNPAYNNGTGGKVFYSIHMNPKMYLAALTFAAEIKNKVIPEYNEKMFPVGSFELKVSWVPLSAIPKEKQSLFYTTTASLTPDGGKTFKNTDVALIGMHVVGVVENHPEFIWATFEHDELGPNYDWKANNANYPHEQLLFQKGFVRGIDGIVYDSATKLGKKPYTVFDLFQYGVPRDNKGNFMKTSQEEPLNFENIDGINQCVKSQLNDVWRNYFYNGSIWLNTDGKSPQQQAQLIDSLGYNLTNATPGSYARGSLNCANVTMETFTQTFVTTIDSINVNNLANCFSCHSGVKFKTQGKMKSPLYLSHVFQDYLNKNTGISDKQVEAIKATEEKRVMQLMKD